MQHRAETVLKKGSAKQLQRTFETSIKDFTAFGSSSMACSAISKHISGTKSMPPPLLKRFHELGISFLFWKGPERLKAGPRTVAG
jgi:hypothetical protein